MWELLIEALIGAVVAGAAAEVASKIFTGKWLHQHLYEWWRELSEQIDAWVKENESLGITRVVGFINRKLDHVIVGANRMVKLAFYAEDSQQRRHVVVEEVELSEEEVAAQFPELQQQKEAMVMEVAYGDIVTEQDSPEPMEFNEADVETESANCLELQELNVDVVLVKIDPAADRTAIIKAIRESTGVKLREARAAVNSMPAVLLTGVEREEAESLKAALAYYGATVAIS